MGKSLWSRITEYIEEVVEGRFGPDGNGSTEVLQPDFAPVLAQRSRQEFQVSEDFEPFVEVQLEVLLCGRSQETAAPAPTTAVGNGTSDSAP